MPPRLRPWPRLVGIADYTTRGPLVLSDETDTTEIILDLDLEEDGTVSFQTNFDLYCSRPGFSPDERERTKFLGLGFPAWDLEDKNWGLYPDGWTDSPYGTGERIHVTTADFIALDKLISIYFNGVEMQGVSWQSPYSENWDYAPCAIDGFNELPIADRYGEDEFVVARSTASVHYLCQLWVRQKMIFLTDLDPVTTTTRDMAVLVVLHQLTQISTSAGIADYGSVLVSGSLKYYGSTATVVNPWRINVS